MLAKLGQHGVGRREDFRTLERWPMGECWESRWLDQDPAFVLDLDRIPSAVPSCLDLRHLFR